MSSKSNSLFRLVRNKKNDESIYGVTISLTPKFQNKSGLTVPYQFFQEVEETRAFVIGNADGAVLGHTLSNLLARHLVILTYPVDKTIFIRVLALHPNIEIYSVTPHSIHPQEMALGGVQSSGKLHIATDSFELEIEARFLESFSVRPSTQDEHMFYPTGEQLDFNQEEDVTFIGTLIDSITGPGSGGHAIPALSQESEAIVPGKQRLALRSSKGLQSATIENSAIDKGLLVGRSRRCKLGRKYSDQDGLSRIHALVIRLHNRIYAIDLASKYGLRDVTKPTVKLHTVLIDNQIGCLVYGAGHLVVEQN
jgi:hypothetical protein